MRRLKVIEAVIVAIVSATVGYFLIFLLSDCAPIKTGSKHDSHVQLFCSDGQYNVMSHLFFKTPEATLISVLHDDAGSATCSFRITINFILIFLICFRLQMRTQ